MASEIVAKMNLTGSDALPQLFQICRRHVEEIVKRSGGALVPDRPDEMNRYVFVALDSEDSYACSGDPPCDLDDCLRCTVGDCGDSAQGVTDVLLYVSEESAMRLIRLLLTAIETGAQEIPLGVCEVSLCGLENGHDWYELPKDPE